MIKDHECFKCRKPTKGEATAFKRLVEGTAQPHQQQLAMKYLIDAICRTHDVRYIPGEPDATAYLNGRAFVGLKVLKMIKVPVGKLALQEDNNNEEAGNDD